MATVLVVDDEPDMVLLLRMTFEGAGHQVAEAANGAAALAMVEDGLAPDLVVTDLMMPVMDGAELITRMRANPRTASIPVVVLTANPTDGLACDLLLTKPFRPAEMIAAAGRLLPAS